MKIIVSSHIDTVFVQPFGILCGGIFRGANDNFASLMAASRTFDDPVWLEPNVEFQATEDEEMSMEGAKAIMKKNNPKDTLIIVMDVTDAAGKKNFTIENIHEVKKGEIKKALYSYNYKIVSNGTESEAWLYAEGGFSVLEIDVPVRGGLHNLDSISRVSDHQAVGKALLSLIYYFKDKDIAAIRSEDD